MNDLGSLGEVLHEPEQYLVSLYARAETAPNPESRISLSDSRDAFGLPRIKVNWQLTPFDKYSLSESVRTVASELGRLDLGRLELADWVMPGNKSWPQPLWGGCHHMGSTRMSEDAGLGVVDRNCRVHSVGNLYIAGSSVFPTSGYVQPTLTIVALALRLGAHLRQQFKMS
jgi:choline dehydrogenase-like flavoprotein